MTSEQLEDAVKALIKEYVRVASVLSAVQIDVQAMRETLRANAPALLNGFSERQTSQHAAILQQMDEKIAQVREDAVARELRRLLEEFDGPKQ